MQANTHTEASATGLQTQHFREEAREIVAKSFDAKSDEYVVLFAGTGMTGAVHKLIDVLGIRIPSTLNTAHGLDKHIPKDCRPVVFTGPTEHHSNEVSWRETVADVIVVPEVRASGRMDLCFLERELEKHKSRPLVICSFSAGSNVTGIANPVVEVARLAKKAGALCFVDYAGAGPYVPMSVKPAPDVEIDAIFCSPHKFPGGPGATGLLIAKRALFANAVPTQPGGGTVSFVSPWAHDYVSTIESREDGGTPGILQAIRCGLAFHIRNLVGIERIRDIDNEECFKAIELWRKHENLYLMGANRTAYHDLDRLPIVSFNVLFPTESPTLAVAPSSAGMREVFSPEEGDRRMLHPHYVAALLNDVYGIQARSGCSCAGPYGINLFELDETEAERMSQLVNAKSLESVKLGWARVNFAFTLSEEEAEFVRLAIEQVAEHGWKLLPLYEMDASTGQYLHRSFDPSSGVHWISELHLKEGGDAGESYWDFDAQGMTSVGRMGYLKRAEQLYEHAATLAVPFEKEVLSPGGNFTNRDPGLYDRGPNGDEDVVGWTDRFFVFPSDALHRLKHAFNSK